MDVYGFGFWYGLWNGTQVLFHIFIYFLDRIGSQLARHINYVPSTLYQGLFIRVVGHIPSRKNIANIANVYSMIFTTYPYPLSPTPYPRISCADLVLQKNYCTITYMTSMKSM